MFCSGLYLVGFMQGNYSCSPLGPLSDCTLNKSDGKYYRYQDVPNVNRRDPDLNYIYEQKAYLCPSVNCAYSDWKKAGPCFTEDGTRKQIETRSIVTDSKYGGTACDATEANLTRKVACTESFRFRRSSCRMIGNAKFGGGISLMVFGLLFILVGYSLAFSAGGESTSPGVIGMYVAVLVLLITGVYYYGLTDGYKNCDRNAPNRSENPTTKTNDAAQEFGMVGTILGSILIGFFHLYRWYKD